MSFFPFTFTTTNNNKNKPLKPKKMKQTHANSIQDRVNHYTQAHANTISTIVTLLIVGVVIVVSLYLSTQYQAY